MTNTNLTDIDGVGPGKADQLRDAGYDTVEDVSNATVDELSNADGFGEGNAGDIIESASDSTLEALQGEIETNDAPEDSADADENGETSAGTNDTADADAALENSSADELFEKGAEDVPWSEEDLTELVGADASVWGDTYALELETDAQILVHTIHVVLEEATSQHQSTNIPLRDTSYGVARKLMSALMQSGELVDIKLILTSEELSSLYRALSAGSTDYASRSGVPAMWAEFETLRAQVNEKRKEAMAE